VVTRTIAEMTVKCPFRKTEVESGGNGARKKTGESSRPQVGPRLRDSIPKAKSNLGDPFPGEEHRQDRRPRTLRGVLS
jgi:hypothetical protein